MFRHRTFKFYKH